MRKLNLFGLLSKGLLSHRSKVGMLTLSFVAGLVAPGLAQTSDRIPAGRQSVAAQQTTLRSPQTQLANRSGSQARRPATQSASSGRSTTELARRPQSRPSFVVTRVPTTEKVVALTYDDGPSAAWTPKFLEVLRRKNVKGTFYMCGNMIKAQPNLARRVHDEGHEVGNHSYNHPLLTKISPDAVRSQLTQTNDLLMSINGGQAVRTMRPPYGGRNAMTDEICRELGLKVILWDVDTNDWRKRSASQITQTVLSSVQPGSVVLFHDRLQGSLDAQEAIIDGLRARGYRFVTVSELLDMQSRPVAVTSSAPVSNSTIQGDPGAPGRTRTSDQ